MSIPSLNYRHDPKVLRYIQPYSTGLTSNTKCNIKIKNILEGSKDVYRFKEMKYNALVSLLVLEDNGFKIILDQNNIYITKQGKKIWRDIVKITLDYGGSP